MKSKIKYLIALVLMTFLGTISSVNAVNITADELGDTIELVKPDATFAYIIGKYVYTNEMVMSTKDIMLGTLSIDITDKDGKTNQDSIYDEMRILYAEWVGTDEEGHSKWNVKNYIGTGDIPSSYNLSYIDYQEAKEIVKYTVTFDNDGTISTSVVKEGKVVTKPEDPTKEGYKFIGWYNGDEVYDFTKPVTGDITLTAKYVIEVDVDALLQAGVNKVNNEYYTALYADKLITYNIVNNDAKASALQNTGLIGGIRDLLKKDGIKELTIKSGDKTYVFDEPNENLEVGQSSAAFLTMVQMLEETTGMTISDITLDDLIGIELDVSIVVEDGYISTLGNTTEQYKASITGTKTPVYKVIFDVDGSQTSSNVKKGKKVEEPVAPTKEGYTFDGWYTDSEFTTKYEFNSELNSNIVLYAKFDVNTYNVKFYDGDNELTDLAQIVEYGKKATSATAPTKVGYTFDGWYTDKELTTAYDIDTLVKEDKILYAKYSVITYDVKFFDGENELTTLKQVVEYGNTATSATAPTKEGYRFIGWYTDSALTTEYNFDTEVKANVVLYAKYEIISYTVKFTGMDNTEQFPDVIVKYGNTVSIPSYTPTKGEAGSAVFAGWYTEDGVLYDFSTPVTRDLTLVVRYTTDTSSVKFYDGDTELTSLAQTIDFGDKATEVEAPEKEGYTFAGWYMDKELSTKYNFDKVVNVDFALYAKYTINTYSVKFYDDDTELTDLTQIVEYGKKATSATAPTKEGYAFAGWYIDDTLATEYNFDTEVKADVKLYAKYTMNTYSVKFYDDDTELTDLAQIVEYGKKATSATAPTKEGYAFVGWYTDDTLATEYNFDTEVKDDMALYAKWKQVVANVTTQAELEAALANSDIATINLIDSISVDKSIIISRSVVINGNNNTMSLTTITSGNNQVLKTYSGEEEITVELKDIKLTGANAALIVLDNSKVIATNVDVSGNAWGGIEVKNIATSSLIATGITNTSEEEGHATIWVDETTVDEMLATISFEDKVAIDAEGSGGQSQAQYYLSQSGNLNNSSDNSNIYSTAQSVTNITADIASYIQYAVLGE